MWKMSEEYDNETSEKLLPQLKRISDLISMVGISSLHCYNITIKCYFRIEVCLRGKYNVDIISSQNTTRCE